ncbi:MAG: S9 family peptidase [Gemmatimonadales bacterium]
MTRSSRFTRLGPLAAVLLVADLGAQRPEVPAALAEQVRRIFGSSEYAATERFGPARWIDGGAAYATVEASATVAGGADIVRYDAATGARTVLISAASLVPSGGTAPLGIEDYQFSTDGSALLIFTNSRKVWRTNTRGDYWVLHRASGRLVRLGGPEAPESSLMYAKFSPAGDRVGYVRGGDLYVEAIAGGSITRLTTGADSLHVNGMTDWVYEEEFGLQDGFRWSPNGDRIAYWHFDMTGVGTFALINDTDSLYPRIIPIQYPKVGTTNSAVRIGVVSAAGGSTTWVGLEGNPRDHYLPRMEWAGPGELVIQHLNRLQNTNRVTLVDAVTGAARVAHTDVDSAWVDVGDDLTWLAGGKEFLWISERDGWRHAYRIARDGSRATLVTVGNYDLVSVQAVDEKGGWLYFIASPGNATQRFLYRTRLDGKGLAERVTPAGAGGSHRYAISPDARWALHTASSLGSPPRVALVSLPSHREVRPLAENAAQRAAVAKVIGRPAEYFKVPIGDGVIADGWMIKPRDFDSTRSYPMLVYVYGEPAGQTVTDQWAGGQGLWYHAQADQGYVVVSVDNEGTPAPRGRAWRKVVYGQIGVRSSAQQAEAVRQLTRRHRYLDPNRVAIWGWSGGGSSTLQAMFRYPDVYQLGMSVAPVPDQLLYDTIYQERYMGLPSLNPEWYAKASPIHVAEGLRGRLLVVHGSGDDNVHYQGTERLVNRLVALGKPFDFMAYPNRSHCICEERGTTLHVYSLLTRYLSEHLPPGGRPLP